MILITGQIYPSRIKVQFENFAITENIGTEREITYRLSGKDNVITIEVEGKSLNDHNKIVQRTRLYSRSVLNCLGVEFGEIIECSLERALINGQEVNLRVYSEPMAMVAEELGIKAIDIFSVVSNNPLALLALDDLVVASADVFLVPINCARCVESLGHILSTSEKATERWERLRNVLSLTRAYVQPISDASIDHRHGFRMDKIERNYGEIVKRSWEIYKRFLAYELNDRKELDSEKFPKI